MKVTTENTKELISKYLDEKEIEYKIQENIYGNTVAVTFEFYTENKYSEQNGLSEPNNINYEYSDKYEIENEDGTLTPIIQFSFNSQFIERDDLDTEPLLEIENDEINEKSDLIEQLDEFLDQVEDLNAAIVDIRENVRKIQDICDENGLNIEDFLTLKYEFNGLDY